MFKNTVKIQFANLMKPLFLNGRNFGEKVLAKPDITMDYDMNRKELYVMYAGRVALIPSAGISSLEPVNPRDIGYEGELSKTVKIHENHPSVADIGSAQVSTPHGYVHEGLGKGQTGQNHVKKN